MDKTRRSAVITPDGILDLPDRPDYGYDDEYGAPSLRAHMVVRDLWHDADIALAKELYQRGMLQVIGKSGGSRAGMEIIPRADPNCTEADFDFQAGRIVVPVSILSLRAVQVRQNGVKDDLLRVLADMHRERPVHIGRLALVRPEDQLSREQVLEALQDHQLAVARGLAPQDCVQEDGTLDLPLEQLHFAFCETNFRTEEKRRVIRFGKHGLVGLQEERHGLPPSIHGKEFYVGGIRISIGPFVAIIDSATNEEGVVHLAARVLDGICTTGLDVPRQVELFNKLYKAAATAGLRVRVRLYHANKDAQRFAKSVINQRTIQHGVSLPDVIELAQNPNRIIEMMHALSPSVADGNPAGYFVGAGRAHKVEWVDNASHGFQNKHLQITTPKFAAGDQDYAVRGNKVTLQPAHELAKRLGYVGQEQSHRNMYFQWGFPDTDTMRDMRDNGVGVFVSHDVRMSDEAFSDSRQQFHNRLKRTVLVRDPDGSPEMVERPPINNLFFTDKEFGAFCKLHAQGARFLFVRHETPDAFGETDMLPEEVLEWHERGFWVKPEAREAVEEADTLIAMYGSHVKGMDDVLEPQVARFALRMKKLFGKRAGFIHGKGPGVMYITDKVARHLPAYARKQSGCEEIEEGMVSIGVGIDLEQQNQKLNHHPHGQLDFGSQHRLVRQKHMNDRAVFNIFNLGGAGTLEEIALSLCSQKLYKNILTPLIFVDPEGIGADGQNFWKKLEAFIDDMSTKKQILLKKPDGSDEAVHLSDAQVEQVQEIKVHLLQGHMKNFIHVVDSYDEAAGIIEHFVEDPVGYYVPAGVKKYEFEMAFSGAADVRKDTHFPMPHWMEGPRYAEMLGDPRWTAPA